MSGEEALGLPSGRVVVVPWDNRWPGLFAAEAERISAALRDHGTSLMLEHTGSTAVSGLHAKPITDILAGHDGATPLDVLIRALESAGYVYRGEQGIPGRHFFRRGEPRAYHLHLTQVGSAFWRDHLDFRDYLRRNTSARDEYSALKVHLALSHPWDREAYIHGKTDFVVRALALARGGTSKHW